MGNPQGLTGTSASESAKVRNSANQLRHPKPLPVSSHPDADPETAIPPAVRTEPLKRKTRPIVSINGADVDPNEHSRAA
jgi:hypothetical protein